MKQIYKIAGLLVLWLLLSNLFPAAYAERPVAGIGFQAATVQAMASSQAHRAFLPAVTTGQSEKQAINFGWAKRGKKIILIEIGFLVSPTEALYLPVAIIDKIASPARSYTSFHFCFFSHRGPPAA